MSKESQDESVDVESTPSSDNKKKAIVAVLLAILLLAIMTQPDKQKETAEANTELALKSPDVMPETVKVKVEASRFTATKSLTRIGVEGVKSSPVFRPDPIQRRRMEVGQLRVQAVYGSSKKAQAAIVNDKVIRQGESMRDGRKVMQVSPDGIHLQRK